MLVKFNSFNPSVNNQNANKINFNRPSFQNAMPIPPDLLRHAQSAGNAERLATRFKTEDLKITRMQAEQLIATATGGAKGVLRDIVQQFKGINVID